MFACLHLVLSGIGTCILNERPTYERIYLALQPLCQVKLQGLRAPRRAKFSLILRLFDDLNPFSANLICRQCKYEKCLHTQ